MLLNVRELELRKVRFDVAYPVGKIDLPESKFRQVTPVTITGIAELTGALQEIRVQGYISCRLEGECDRCLELSPLSIEGDFDLSYRPARLDSETGDAEIDEEESEVGYYEGAGLDLADVLREQILLWLPLQWVCRSECKGICPLCGQNRNRVACTCRSETADDRWAALRDI